MEQEKTLQLLVKKVENMEKTLQRIETELDEAIYPPEERIKPEFIEEIKKAKKEKAKTYASANEYFSKLEKENV